MGLAPQDCDKRSGSRSCSAWYIARRLGHGDKGGPWVLRQIEALIAHEGFPPPIVLYHFAANDPAAPAAKVAALTAQSRWQLEAVDRWFDGQASARLPRSIAAAGHARGTALEGEALDAHLAALAPSP